MELLCVDESPVKGEGTPGDFANVVRQRNLLGEELAPEEFLRRLMTECRWKERSGAAVVA